METIQGVADGLGKDFDLINPEDDPRYRDFPTVAFLIPAIGFLAFTSFLVPITGALVAVLVILVFSYRQTIKAYPSAGGAYIVTKDNLGLLPAQVAGVALLTDYILTVAVSVSAGMAALYSAVPSFDQRNSTFVNTSAATSSAWSEPTTRRATRSAMSNIFMSPAAEDSSRATSLITLLRGSHSL